MDLHCQAFAAVLNMLNRNFFFVIHPLYCNALSSRLGALLVYTPYARMKSARSKEQRAKSKEQRAKTMQNYFVHPRPSPIGMPRQLQPPAPKPCRRPWASPHGQSIQPQAQRALIVLSSCRPSLRVARDCPIRLSPCSSPAQQDARKDRREG